MRLHTKYTKTVRTLKPRDNHYNLFLYTNIKYTWSQCLLVRSGCYVYEIFIAILFY